MLKQKFYRVGMLALLFALSFCIAYNQSVIVKQDSVWKLVVRDSVFLDTTQYRYISHYEKMTQNFYSTVPFAIFEQNLSTNKSISYIGQTMDCPTGKESYKSKLPVRIGAWGVLDKNEIVVWDNLGQKFCFYHNEKPVKTLHSEIKKEKLTILGFLDRFIVRNDTMFLPCINFDHYQGRTPITSQTPLFYLIHSKTGKIIKKIGTWDSAYRHIQFNMNNPQNIVYLKNVSYFLNENKLYFVTKLSKTVKSIDIHSEIQTDLPYTYIEADSIFNHTLLFNSQTNTVFRQYDIRKQNQTLSMLDIYMNDREKKITVEIIPKMLNHLFYCNDKNELWFNNHRNAGKTIIYKVKLVPDN
jgi:hypothetical protein